MGRGNEKAALEDLVRSLGIPEYKVIFTGFRSDVLNIIRSLDIYIQPSLSEGHPLSLLEAMGIGIPVIATEVGGMPEVIGQNEYGLLVQPASSEGLCNGMITVAKDRDVYKGKALIARGFVRENFSLDKMTSKYIELYERTLRVKQGF